jgi:hypothetical protein
MERNLLILGDGRDDASHSTMNLAVVFLKSAPFIEPPALSTVLTRSTP